MGAEGVDVTLLRGCEIGSWDWDEGCGMAGGGGGEMEEGDKEVGRGQVGLDDGYYVRDVDFGSRGHR